ncbi:hypothetical protein [Changchengzhania lutea]|uniref:hypothetical protein n=1 Tax=Changchengzhania lutea TaxID=2049305 RepID=UPI00115EBAE0|nr:hypothetical protein [Changchengzhania lutea]
MKKKRIHNIKQSGFKTPEDYFSNLEDVILHDIKLKANISDAGFKMPEAYLNSIESSVIKKLSHEDGPKVIQLLSKRNLLYVSAIAATILLLFNLSIFETKSNWDSIDTETVENYMLNEDISVYELASLFTEDELAENNFIQTDINTEQLETYILNHSDIEVLIIE